jgi:tRNA U55 pseudouridine synthase TruB
MVLFPEPCGRRLCRPLRDGWVIPLGAHLIPTSTPPPACAPRDPQRARSRTRPVQVHDFKVWRASDEDIRGGAAAASAAAAAAGARLPPAAAAAAVVPPLAPSAAGPRAAAGGDVAALTGRVVRFSVKVTGRAHVRSLVDMYGRRLRACACLDELRRTEVASLTVGEAWPVEALLPILERYKR